MAREAWWRRWATPRFPLEMAVASLATLVVAIIVGDAGRQTHSSPPVKVDLQANPRTLPVARADEARLSAFVENFALAHVAPPLPEASVDAAAMGSEPQSRAVQVLAKSKPRPAPRPAKVLPPSSRPALAALPDRATAAAAATSAEAAKPGFRIPLVSDAASGVSARLPSGRNIVDGVGAVGRRIGSIFARD